MVSLLGTSQGVKKEQLVYADQTANIMGSKEKELENSSCSESLELNSSFETEETRFHR